MKKLIAVFGSLLVLASTKSKAQNPQQPVKKETVKPTSGPAPQADAADVFLKLDGVKGESSTSDAKGANPIYKGAQSDTNNQVARRPVPPPPNDQVARHPTAAPPSKQVPRRPTPPPANQRSASVRRHPY